MKYVYTDLDPDYEGQTARDNRLIDMFEQIPDHFFQTRGASPSISVVAELKERIRMLLEAEQKKNRA